MVETQNEGTGNMPQQPGEVYTIFTVDPSDRKYYLTAVEQRREVTVQEETEGSRVFNDIQLWYMVTADEQQQQPPPPPLPPLQQRQQQQQPFVLKNKKLNCPLVVASKSAAAGDKQGTKPEQIVASAGSSRTQPQIRERRRTPETGSNSAGKQPARGDGPLQVVLGKHDAEGERWTTEGTTATAVVAGDANKDRRLSRTLYIQRASNANLVFKAVNTGGMDGSIVELSDKPKARASANPRDQYQLFCCWTIVPAGDHIIADGGLSLSYSSMDHPRLLAPAAQSGSFSQRDTRRIPADNGASLSAQPGLGATGETREGGNNQGDNKKGKNE